MNDDLHGSDWPMAAAWSGIISNFVVAHIATFGSKNRYDKI